MPWRLRSCLAGNVLFYEAGFKTQYWFGRDTDRWMGTLDQPLALSLAISVAAPLVAGLTRAWLQVVLLALMAVAVLISQSRVGLVALAVAAVAVVLFVRRPVWVKTVLLLVMAGAVTALMASPLVTGVMDRVADDTGSTEARGIALEYFLSRWNDFAVAGQGSGSSYRVAVQAGLETSFENPTLMYGVDFGILFSVLYFGSMAVLVLRGMGTGYPGLTLAGIMALVIPQTYSSLATRSAGGIIIWTVLAMVVIATDGGAAGGREDACLHRSEGPGARCRQPARRRGVMIARRQFLGLTAAGAVLGVAGCSACPAGPAASGAPGATARPRPVMVPAASAAKDFVTAGAIAAPGEKGPFTVAALLEAPSFFVAHRGSGTTGRSTPCAPIRRRWRQG